MKFRLTDTSQACMKYNGAGTPFEEFSCLYPTLGKSYLPFESNYDPVFVRDWMRENAWFPIVVACAYLLMIVGGQAFFKNRPAWNWRGALAVWNLALSLFSAWGFLRVAPQLFHNLVYYTWRENLCVDPESTMGSGSTGLWAQLFVLSKIPELVDTAFIIVHKKKLIFLHWFHHLTVFYVCWHGYINNSSMGIFIIVMNYAVHAFMYFYYFLMAIRAKPAWLRAQWITIAQISQMVIGFSLTPFYFYLYFVEKIPGCVGFTSDMILQMGLLYGFFLFLFLNFFFKRYSVSIKKQKSI